MHAPSEKREKERIRGKVWKGIQRQRIKYTETYMRGKERKCGKKYKDGQIIHKEGDEAREREIQRVKHMASEETYKYTNKNQRNKKLMGRLVCIQIYIDKGETKLEINREIPREGEYQGTSRQDVQDL